MLFCLDLLRTEHVGDRACLVDDKGGAGGSHIGPAIHLLFHPYAKRLLESCLRVGDQREGKVLLGDKTLVRFGAVLAYANNLVTCLSQGVVVVAEAAGLSRAPAGVIFGIEIER